MMVKYFCGGVSGSPWGLSGLACTSQTENGPESNREWARIKCEYGPVKDGYERESLSYLYKVLQTSHREVVILGVQQLHEIGSEEGTRARLGVDTTDTARRGESPTCMK